MQRIGHRPGGLLAARPILWAALGGLAAMGPAAWMWGFEVDDAFISIRYARHLADGAGWRFNAHGPSTDGVTPLPWPLCLAVLARADPLVVLWRAKVLGLVAWGGTGLALGRAIGRVAEAPPWARAAALLGLALSVPVSAYAVSGMETPVATALATLAVLAVGRPVAAAVLAGWAASLRPEMAVWALVLALGSGLAARVSPRRLGAAGAWAVLPFAACAVVRLVVWGRAVPLAVLAKPSDLAHGWMYARAACLVSLTPLLVVAPIALGRSPRALAIVCAAVAHMGAVALVGGDWMPYARLVVPIVPSLAYASVLASHGARPWATALRSLTTVAVGVGLIGRGGTAGRLVGGDRRALVLQARPVLEGVRRVAALDVGWVGAAVEADVVDLAGLTDPEIAALPGGHTSKRVDGRFLLDRDPDALLLYAPLGLPDEELRRWKAASYPRTVERRLARERLIASHFAPAAWLPLGARGAGYVLLRATPSGASPPDDDDDEVP